jgi:uncharacterized protein YpuA (DUF1002 family)
MWHHYTFMKKIIPYIISYLIVVAGTVAYSCFSHPTTSTFVTLRTTLSHDDLVAKLQQVGIPESALHLSTMTYAPFATLVHHCAFYAVIFGAFLGLAYLFERVISKSRP